jgi:hypothetical protein
MKDNCKTTFIVKLIQISQLNINPYKDLLDKISKIEKHVYSNRTGAMTNEDRYYENLVQNEILSHSDMQSSSEEEQYLSMYSLQNNYLSPSLNDNTSYESILETENVITTTDLINNQKDNCIDDEINPVVGDGTIVAQSIELDFDIFSFWDQGNSTTIDMNSIILKEPEYHYIQTSEEEKNYNDSVLQDNISLTADIHNTELDELYKDQITNSALKGCDIINELDGLIVIKTNFQPIAIILKSYINARGYSTLRVVD